MTNEQVIKRLKHLAFEPIIDELDEEALNIAIEALSNSQNQTDSELKTTADSVSEADVIYRQDAIDAMCAVCGNDCDKSEFVYNAPQDEQVIICPEHYVLTQLPSAQRTGEWIQKPNIYGVAYCSECDYELHTNDTNFCPNCGADMRGE